MLISRINVSKFCQCCFNGLKFVDAQQLLVYCTYLQHISDTAVLKSARTEVTISATERLEHADSGVVEDGANSSPDLRAPQLNDLNVPHSLQEDHNVSKPQLTQPTSILSPLPARHVSNVLASSLAATHSDQACLVSEVLNKVPTVSTP